MTHQDRIHRDSNHNRAMDLSTLARRLTSDETYQNVGHRIEAIAAQMEEQAAHNQPAENSIWKSALYRSAGWMYINASSREPRLLLDAQH